MAYSELIKNLDTLRTYIRSFYIYGFKTRDYFLVRVRVLMMMKNAVWKITLKLRKEEIELVGLCTGICVISNAFILKAKLPEVKITVDASCCACVTPESHKTALSAMKLCQINVICGSIIRSLNC